MSHYKTVVTRKSKWFMAAAKHSNELKEWWIANTKLNKNPKTTCSRRGGKRKKKMQMWQWDRITRVH